MPKDNLSVSLPGKMRSLVEREAKRRKRSRSAVVREALQVYFRLRRIGVEGSNAQERRAVAKGRKAYTQGDLVSLEVRQRALGFGDHQAS
jgi:metal-responsive CopG/Arc/MetJ family transcriptional regulator